METIDPKEIEIAFFEGMRKGYVTSKERALGSWGPPGTRLVVVTVGRFCIHDEWVTTGLSDMSVGRTTISCEENVLWYMLYHGWYLSAAIPFLKRCLMSAYAANKFLGGRGENVDDPLYAYSNIPDGPGDFRKFSGRERIFRIDGGQSAGYHDYCGGLMLHNS